MLNYQGHGVNDEKSEDEKDNNSEWDHQSLGQTIEIVQEVGLSDEQMQRVYELIKSERFIELKKRFQRNPTSTNGIMEFISNEFNDLNEVFEKNKNLMLLILTGNAIRFVDPPEAAEEDDDEEDEGFNENEIDNSEAQLNTQDRENIRNVN